MRFDTLDDWLSWQSQLHPVGIDLGLDRCGLVADTMDLRDYEFKVVAVAGTNGKGSCVAFMESMLAAAGLRVGCYCSPHLLRYNERIRVAGKEVTDEDLLDAFSEVDNKRGQTSLTYFEFGTLAAMSVFKRAGLDVVLLEVGLGGRLDAVNLFDSDVSVLTSIDLDHTDWLGPDRESIGFEKAGILRAGKPAVCGDPNPPSSVTNHAARLEVPLHQLNKDFWLERDADRYCYHSSERDIQEIPAPAMDGAHQLDNASVAIAALALLDLFDDVEPIRRGVAAAMLPGRVQTLCREPLIMVDVAHNPHAVSALARVLAKRPIRGETHAFLGMLSDKDVTATLRAASDVVDHWHIAGIAQSRGANRVHMEKCASLAGLKGTPAFHESLENGYAETRASLATHDRLIAFGSFFTAAHVLRVETSQ